MESSMDYRIARLRTPAECEQFILNVQTRLPELAQQARRRAVELRAEEHMAGNPERMETGLEHVLERELLLAVYAYEEVLSKKRGKRQPAHRTRQMIDRHGIIGAAERAVNRKAATSGFQALAKMNMLDFAFEAVILRHAHHFSSEAVRRSEERLKDWKQQTTE